MVKRGADQNHGKAKFLAGAITAGMIKRRWLDHIGNRYLRMTAAGMSGRRRLEHCRVGAAAIKRALPAVVQAGYADHVFEGVAEGAAQHGYGKAGKLKVMIR